MPASTHLDISAQTADRNCVGDARRGRADASPGSDPIFVIFVPFVVSDSDRAISAASRIPRLPFSRRNGDAASRDCGDVAE